MSVMFTFLDVLPAPSTRSTPTPVSSSPLLFLAYTPSMLAPLIALTTPFTVLLFSVTNVPLISMSSPSLICGLIDSPCTLAFPVYSLSKL